MWGHRELPRPERPPGALPLPPSTRPSVTPQGRAVGMAGIPEWEGGRFWVKFPGPVPSAKGLRRSHSKGHGELWTLPPKPLTTGPAGALGCRLGGAEEVWEGVQEVLQSPGPRQRLRGLGRRKGKGDVIAAWNLLFGGVVMETGRLRVGKNSKPKRV